MQAAPPPAASVPPPVDLPQRLSIGITEQHPSLLDPRPQPEPFDGWRDEIAALRPRYVRVLVEWHKLQPDPALPAAMADPRGGCLRDVAPCQPHAGLQAQFEAIGQLRAQGREVEPVVQVYGVPEWAARAPGACEREDTETLSRAIRPAALPAYRALLRDLAATAQAAGAPVRWWSPWNEPNHPWFITPQREAPCEAASPSRSPAVYTSLVRAARAELGPDARLLLGDLAGYVEGSSVQTGVAEFLAALPDDVACDGAAWAIHQYVGPQGTGEERRRGEPGAPDAITTITGALDARPCSAGQPVWITETGAGAVAPGRERDGTEAELLDGCRQLARALRRWDADPRVDAVFPYTAREDPLFPVGLIDPTLVRSYPVLELWQAWGQTAPGDPPPAPGACATRASDPSR